MDELCKAAKECRRGVSNKVGPVEFNLHRLSSCKRLKDDIMSGRYKIRPGTKVIVYRPKRRVATAPWFRDRVWQRSMCNNGVYEDLTRSFILENIACQKGKGADMAIRRVVKMLQRLHRKEPGATVYGVHLDVKKVFSVHTARRAERNGQKTNLRREIPAVPLRNHRQQQRREVAGRNRRGSVRRERDGTRLADQSTPPDSPVGSDGS